VSAPLKQVFGHFQTPDHNAIIYYRVINPEYRLVTKTLKLLGSILLVFILGFGGFVGWMLYPHASPKFLPPPLVSSNSEEGRALLEGAEIRVDYTQLSNSFQPQRLTSYCGVASGVAVLNALGKNVNQSTFFTADTDKVRSQFSVIFGGMSLHELGGLLKAHGVQTLVRHADESSVEEFRITIEQNLATAHDYLIVNYQRKSLGQDEVGHISPLSAYNRKNDSVLIMDTTSNNYPPTWVPVKMLFTAMMTTDSASNKMRGYIEVSK